MEIQPSPAGVGRPHWCQKNRQPNSKGVRLSHGGFRVGKQDGPWFDVWVLVDGLVYYFM